MEPVHSPMKHTAAPSPHTVLLGLCTDEGQTADRPEQEAVWRHPLSDRQAFPAVRVQAEVQHGPWDGEQAVKGFRVQGVSLGGGSRRFGQQQDSVQSSSQPQSHSSPGWNKIGWLSLLLLLIYGVILGGYLYLDFPIATNSLLRFGKAAMNVSRLGGQHWSNRSQTAW